MPDGMSGRCNCKPGYYGDTCQYSAIIGLEDEGLAGRCREDQYFSEEDSVGGCINCFCMAIPTGTGQTSCSSSQLYRDKIRADIDFTSPELALVDSTLERQINGSDLVLNTTNREWSFDQFQSLGEDVFYWKLPAEFLGNKVKTISHEC